MTKIVIEVPGWSSPGVEWRISPISSRLKECGYEVERFHNCDFGLTDIYHNADRLIQRANRLQAWGYEVHLIGHSMGGLVALEASYSCATTCVTICSPLMGARSKLARFAPWQSARQMAPNSDFLKQISEPYVPVLTIGSRFDELVALQSSVPYWSKNPMVLGFPGHVTPLFSQRVANRVVEFIASKGYTN